MEKTANAASVESSADLEHALGLQSSRAMSIENLTTAARAAGFAMAASEGPEADDNADTGQSGQWRPDAAMRLHQADTLAPQETPAKVSIGDWVRGVLTFGRGAPA